MEILRQIWSIRVILIMFLTPMILLPLPLYIATPEAKAAFVLIAMGVYWITEVIPIYVTALLPIFMFPMLGIVTSKNIATAYITDTLMTFIGGLIMAVAIETWDIHKRMALRVLLMVGSEPRWLMLGLMLSTWFISMWISNSATTAMMIPIAQAILLQLKGTNKALKTKSQTGTTQENKDDLKVTEIELESTRPDSEKRHSEDENDSRDEDDDDPHYKRTCKAISLCIAYAANAGGIGSLTGTGPNLVVKDHADMIFPLYNEENNITYTNWMSFGLPLSFILMIISWAWLQLIFLRCRGACDCCTSDPDRKGQGEKVKKIIREHYDALGPITYAQGSVLVMFCIMVLCWISRDLGGVGGWGSLFNKGYVKDSTSAMLIAVLLFVLPSKLPRIFCKAEKYGKVEQSRALLVWQDVHENLPWGLFLLLGGGFALAKGCQDSGLSQYIGEQLTVFKGLNPWLTMIILCYISSFCTEVISNVATATIIMPILSSLAINTGINPLFYMLPSSIACSFAYMLPVATAPNALVFAYGHLRIIDMVGAGFILNTIAVPILVFATFAWGNPIFHLDVLPPGFMLRQLWSIRVLLIVFLTPVILLPLPLYIATPEAKCAFVLIMMAVYWVSEAIPIAVTGLLPAFLFPMLGVVKAKVIAPAYISDTIMVFLGGLIMAVAIEKWDIHKRMALRVLMTVGSEPRWLMMGLMLSTWFLSMWISNSATTAMMIPIAQAILLQLKGTKKALKEKQTHSNGLELKDGNEKSSGQNSDADKETGEEEEDPHYKRICKGMSLCICYAANSGGIASLTGTGPNLVIKDHAETVFAEYGEDPGISFTSWMSFGFPLSSILVVICWIWLQIFFLRCKGICDCCKKDDENKEKGEEVKRVIKEQYRALGPVTYAQSSVLVMFFLLVASWISRDLGGVGGWGDLFEEGYVRDSTPALLIAVLLFVLPSKLPRIFCCANKYEVSEESDGPVKSLLVWKDIHEKLPWSLFLLLGGGFALAKGCQESGLSEWIGEQLSVFSGLNPWLMLLILCYICSFFTEVTSNVAITTIIMPILSSLAINTGVNPLFYMLPAGISTSFAFMLPVATPPNALVFAYGHLRIINMASAGFVLNIIAVPILVMATYAWGSAIFNLEVLPSGFAPNATAQVLNLTKI